MGECYGVSFISRKRCIEGKGRKVKWKGRREGGREKREPRTEVGPLAPRPTPVTPLPSTCAPEPGKVWVQIPKWQVTAPNSDKKWWEPLAFSEAAEAMNQRAAETRRNKGGRWGLEQPRMGQIHPRR